MKKVHLFLSFLIVGVIVGLLFAAGVYAADAGTVADAAAVPTAAQSFATVLQQTVFPVIGSILLGLFSWACTKLGQKFHIDSLTQKDNLLMSIAAQGVAYAEEKAASLVGSKSELTGSAKLDLAVAYICRAIPTVSPDQAQRAATAALAMIPGVGATGAAAVAYTSGQVSPASSVIITPSASGAPSTEDLALQPDASAS